MPSHLFSILARVGFEMAWLAEVVVDAAREMKVVVVAWRLTWERLARSAPDVDNRIILLSIRARAGSLSVDEEGTGCVCKLSR